MKRIKLLIVLLCTGLLMGIAAQAYRSAYYARQDRTRMQILKKKWGAGSFAEIPASLPALAALLRPTVELSITNDLLDGEMKSELSYTIGRLLCCFSTGDRAAYQAFHFPVDTAKYGQFNPGRMAIIRNAAREAAAESKFTLPENASDEEVFTVWGFYQATQPPYKVCTNCWRTANVDDIRFQVRLLSRTNVPSLHSVARQFEPLADTSLFKSVVTYEPSCQALLDAGESVVFTCARIPVQMNRGHVGVYPVYASFYWSGAHSRWIPWELALPSAEGSIRVWF